MYCCVCVRRGGGRGEGGEDGEGKQTYFYYAMKFTAIIISTLRLCFLKQ